jgi:sigma-54 dependent transcriptional regulator, acetoin dehydrogenase operon transcriptional activator AcoR
VSTICAHGDDMSAAREYLWKLFTDSLRTQLNPHDHYKRIFIQESWKRSREARVKPRERLLRRAEDAELEITLEADSLLMQAARSHLERYSKEQRTSHVLCLTNARGLILISMGDPVWRAEQGLMTGFDWSESVMGTNGAGTALATDQAVVVIGPEHYLEMFHNATCVGVPLHSRDGELVGALDFSTRVEDSRVEHVLDLVLLGSSIEAEFGIQSGAKKK